MGTKNASIGALALILLTLVSHAYAQLQVGFYSGKCSNRDVEKVIFDSVRGMFRSDATLVGALVRMNFHDCFVNGCDASLLLDGPGTEKTGGPNLGVRGFEVIDDLKSTLEGICPGVVSCADIIQISTRVVVFLAGGKWYEVETGREDGFVSNADDAEGTLPGPQVPVSTAIDLFSSKGLTTEDFVLLLGVHTVGFTHCSFFEDRLVNFQNTGRPDPTMSSSLVSVLRQRCPINSPTDNLVFLDRSQGSAFVFDNKYFKAIRAHKGVLQIDQKMASDSKTKNIVKKFANTGDFRRKFGNAMVKMGRLDVLTGGQGEVRSNCRSVN